MLKWLKEILLIIYCVIAVIALEGDITFPLFIFIFGTMWVIFYEEDME